MRKNFLVIAPFFPRTDRDPLVGGFINNPAYLWGRIAEAGSNVTVITYGRPAGDWTYRQVRVFSIGMIPSKGIVYTVLLELGLLLALIRKMPHGRLHQIRVHHTGGLALLFLKLLKRCDAPFVVTAHGTSVPEISANELATTEKKYRFEYAKKFSRWLQYKLDRVLYKKADIVVSPSKFQLQELMDVYGVSFSKIKVLHHGFDETIFKYSKNAANKLRTRLGIGSSDIVVLLVARAAPKKGIETFIEAVALYSSIYLNDKVRFIAIVGDPLHRQTEIDITSAFEGGSESLILMRNVPECDLSAYYSLSRILVVPTVGYESVPSVIYEATACMCSILASRLPGIEETIDGQFLDNNNPKHIAERIKHILENDIQTVLKKECKLGRLLPQQVDIDRFETHANV